MEHLALEANRFSTVGRIVSGMMHDMGTPLTVIRTQTDFLLVNQGQSERHRRVKTIQAQVDHCSGIVRSTMSFLHHERQRLRFFHVNDVIQMCLEVAKPFLREEGVTVVTDLTNTDPVFEGNLVLIRQALLNLITNACHAMEDRPGAKEIRIESWSEGANMCVSLEDTGPGVPQAYRSRIFDTFFTTKRSKGGTGLGLAVIQNVMKQHGGTIALTESSEKGAKFVITLPRHGQ